jgi:predicted RNA-binding protein YlqC (UPF0109 family)
MIKDLVLYAVKQLVSKPENVVVTAIQNAERNAIEIAVHESDRGKVIGKNGQTIKALRMLVNAMTPDDRRIMVDITK